MRLEQHRTLWGNIDDFEGDLADGPHRDIDTLIPDLAALGYDGLEMPLKLALFLGPERLKTLLLQHQMLLTLSIYTDGAFNAGDAEFNLWGGAHPGFSQPISAVEMVTMLAKRSEQHELQSDSQTYETEYETVEMHTTNGLQKQVQERHEACFKEQVEACYQLFGDRREGGLLTLVIAHDLRDNFPWAMAADYFRDALAWENETNYVVAHETHRKRFLHSPWAIRDFLLKYPDIRSQLRICADYSHLMCVAEVDTSDPVLNQAIDFLVPNVIHTQCRVGYDHGPQVVDPRLPEWIRYMEGSERWWDEIWKSQLARGCEYTTMIAEHGAPTYQACMPGTQDPLASIWDVNHWVQLRRQKRFEELFGTEHQTSRLVPSESQGYKPVTKIIE
ncbi:MAG: sugar phosphate isomerase/epimerase [Parasphingorhabdus sp.]|jgi:sugar phosphate isomerase/epimerase